MEVAWVMGHSEINGAGRQDCTESDMNAFVYKKDLGKVAKVVKKLRT